MNPLLIALVLFCLAPFTVANASLISITTGDFRVDARHNAPPTAVNSFSQTTIPVHRTESVTSGGASAFGTLDWTETTSAVSLDFDADLSTSTLAGSHAAFRILSLQFKSLVDGSYELSGSMLFPVQPWGGLLRLRLENLTTNTTLFAGDAVEVGPAGDPFTLELSDSVAASVIGSLSGLVQAGHDYELTGRMLVAGNPNFNVPAPFTGGGGINMTVRGVSASVPSPPTLLLLATTLVGVGLCRGRRRRIGT